MFDVVLHTPEIPPNTGNAMRLCANTGCTLHLIEPLGFELDDARLRRAGMDYRDKAVVRVHDDLAAWREVARPGRVFAFAKRGEVVVDQVAYLPGDSLLFGSESVGLPDEILGADWIDAVVRIPMRPGLRSLNLSNSVAIAVYEAWRQHTYAGSDDSTQG
jgi:tRNA (cytidine/uridine-2'-O-)-methyltransferase